MLDSRRKSAKWFGINTTPAPSPFFYSASIWPCFMAALKLLSFFRFFFYKNIFFHHQKTNSMEITGRVTADAKVSPTKNEKKVTNFTIAINDRYKTKEGELKEVVTYVNCSYWIASKVADVLKKGTIVELGGRISANAYTNKDGQPKASLNFHVNSIKIHQFAKKSEGTVNTPAEAVTSDPADDLPF
jgi:single-strand DNA-binding protein